MDHIREAVIRARDKRKSVPEQAAARKGARAPMARDVPLSSVDLAGFSVLNCNLAGFSDNRIISNEHDPVLNSYRVLRTRVLQKMGEEGWRTLAVVAAAPGAGKTVTAINLSIAIASSQTARVVLSDFDFYRPSVARYLGLPQGNSVLDFFEGSAPFENVTYQIDFPNLLVQPNDRVSRRGAEFLNSERLEALFDSAIGDYGAQIVVMDTSPILGCDDTLSLLPHIDCVLLVAASGETKASDLKEARRLLQKTNIVGTVLNMAPASSLNSSYYYS